MWKLKDKKTWGRHRYGQRQSRWKGVATSWCKWAVAADEKYDGTTMWANAQRDGRPAKCRWRPLFNIAKVGWRPLLECHAVTLPRCETRWNLQGCPKVVNRSQPLVGRSSPYYEDVWRRYWCLTSFFSIVDTCLSCEHTGRQSCVMVPKWRFLRPVFSASRVQHI